MKLNLCDGNHDFEQNAFKLDQTGRVWYFKCKACAMVETSQLPWSVVTESGKTMFIGRASDLSEARKAELKTQVLN